MLWELSVTEQRCPAVLEVMAGVVGPAVRLPVKPCAPHVGCTPSMLLVRASATDREELAIPARWEGSGRGDAEPVSLGSEAGGRPLAG
jgi:hypothetical protein